MKAVAPSLSALAALLGLLFARPAIADSETFLNVGAVILCVSEESVGFNWEHGTYKQVNFRAGTKRLFKILPAKKCLTGSFEQSNYSNEERVFKTGGICVEYGEVGDEPTGVGIGCREYLNGKINDTLEHSIFCDGTALIPYTKLDVNGLYELATLSDDLSAHPIDGYKDSSYVEWGRCSVISNP